VPADPFHTRLLAIALALPEAVEDWPWGSIHCKVAGKIFVGWSRNEAGIMSVGFRTTIELQSMLVGTDERFTVAKYVGKYGGIDMTLGPKPDWGVVEQFIVESYRILAPKRLVRELDARALGSSAVRVSAGPGRSRKASKETTSVPAKPTPRRAPKPR
jgi:hypothetical protein